VATFVSQPVHATYACKSASAYTSANASRPAVSPCSGDHPDTWKAKGRPWSYAGCGDSSLFSTYFSTTTDYPANTTLAQVLDGASDTEVRKLARNMVAALLNLRSGKIGVGVFTEGQLKIIWTSAISTGYVPTAGAAAWNASGVNVWLRTVFPAA
jgi:hypothetical protein